MKPYHYLFTVLFTLGLLLPSFAQAKVSEGHKKAAKYMKTLPSKGQRSPASAGKHKVKHSAKTAKNHSSSNRKPASKKKAKKAKSHSKKSKKKSKSYGG